MLGSELKKIRNKMQITQKKFAERLCVNQGLLSQMENGDKPVSSKVIKALSTVVRKEVTITKTDKVFSKTNFLLNMLTGNVIVDDLYINSQWLKDLDNRKVALKETKIFIEDNKGTKIGLLGTSLEYIIENIPVFYVKKEWLK